MLDFIVKALIAKPKAHATLELQGGESRQDADRRHHECQESQDPGDQEGAVEHLQGARQDGPVRSDQERCPAGRAPDLPGQAGQVGPRGCVDGSRGGEGVFPELLVEGSIDQDRTPLRGVVEVDGRDLQFQRAASA